MAFHETPSQETRRQLLISQFYLKYSFPFPSSTSLKELDHFVYLGFCLDSKLLLHRAVMEITEKAKKTHNSVVAVFYTLRYGKSDYNPDVFNFP